MFDSKVTTQPINTNFDPALIGALQTSAQRALAQQQTALGILREVPRKRAFPGQYPLPFTTTKQRKAFYASDGFGKGIPYRRTGGTARAWYAEVKNSAGGVRFEVGNRSKHARYLYGGLQRDNALAMLKKQPFHTITGWTMKNKTTNEMLVMFGKDVKDDLLKNGRVKIARVIVGGDNV